MFLSLTFPFLPVCPGLRGIFLLHYEADGRHIGKADTKILSAGGRFSDVTGRHGLDGCRTDLTSR